MINSGTCLQRGMHMIHDTPLHREPRSGVTVFKILVSTSIEESLLFVIIKL